ncbi:unnamed protein product, partial [marine sediment metagenome]
KFLEHFIAHSLSALTNFRCPVLVKTIFAINVAV